MPYNRPGRMKYVTATKVTNHGAPSVESGYTGVAVKQKEPGFALALNQRAVIAINEDFAIIAKGVVSVPAVGGAIKGTPIYITTADNTLSTAAGAGKVKFGVVESLAPERGTKPGTMRVDLDAKDSF